MKFVAIPIPLRSYMRMRRSYNAFNHAGVAINKDNKNKINSIFMQMSRIGVHFRRSCSFIWSECSKYWFLSRKTSWMYYHNVVDLFNSIFHRGLSRKEFLGRSVHWIDFFSLFSSNRLWQKYFKFSAYQKCLERYIMFKKIMNSKQTMDYIIQRSGAKIEFSNRYSNLPISAKMINQNNA